MRALVVLCCVGVFSCSKCDDRKTLRELLSTKGVRVKLINTNVGEPQSAFLEVAWAEPPERCPKLDPEVHATIDGKPAEAELGGARKNETLPSLRCDAPRFIRLDVAELEFNHERHFVLEDRSMRFEASLRRVWESGSLPVPGPYPGPGGRWFIAWEGPAPRDAVFGNDRLGVTQVDGGLELAVPDPLSPWEERLHLQFPSYEVSACSFGTCEAGGIDFWDFELDGGVVVKVDHTLL